MPSPRLSIIVVVYNMQREAPRTLHSLSPSYQEGVDPSDYEVLVVDNGSDRPLESSWAGPLAENFRYLAVADAPPSPARAINFGVAQSRGESVGIMIDGARMVSPGAVRWSLAALAAFRRPVVGTIGFHLGPDLQTRSVLQGYDQRREDELLASIGWPSDGYRLFEISAFAGSALHGWFRPINESNMLSLPRRLFEELGGYEERFVIAGGGLVNLDFYRRACDSDDSTLVTLLGEANFHQIHGGAHASQPPERSAELFEQYGEEYARIRGKPFETPTREAIYFGHVPPAAAPWLKASCELFDAG